jgi:hypothetical protein
MVYRITRVIRIMNKVFQSRGSIADEVDFDCVTPRRV